MASFAEFTDIEAVWRPLTNAEQGVATALLEVASALLRSRVQNIDERIASGDLDPVLPKHAVVGMVKRVLLNPEAQKSESTGPFSVTWDLERASGLLAVTDDDLALVEPPAGRRVRNIQLRAGLR